MRNILRLWILKNYGTIFVTRLNQAKSSANNDLKAIKQRAIKIEGK